MNRIWNRFREHELDHNIKENSNSPWIKQGFVKAMLFYASLNFWLNPIEPFRFIDDNESNL